MEGTIPYEFVSATALYLEELRLNTNQLYGTIPSDDDDDNDNDITASSSASLWSKLTNLKILYLANNQLSSTIPSSLWNHLVLNTHNRSMLEVLSLGSNMLTGSIMPIRSTMTMIMNTNSNNSNNNNTTTTTKASSFLSKLRFLDLSYNFLTGNIEFGGTTSLLLRLPNLEHLHLSRNSLSGSISSMMMANNNALVSSSKNNFTTTTTSELQLRTMEIDHNLFSGTIPQDIIGLHLTKLEHFIIDENSFSGTLDKFVTSFIYYGSDADDSTPNTANITTTTTTSPASYTSSNIQTLSLRGNDFSGTIPTTEIGLLSTSLKYLALSRNYGLSGTLPLTTTTGIGLLLTTNLEHLYLSELPKVTVIINTTLQHELLSIPSSSLITLELCGETNVVVDIANDGDDNGNNNDLNSVCSTGSFVMMMEDRGGTIMYGDCDDDNDIQCDCCTCCQ